MSAVVSDLPAHFRRALEDCDVALCRKIWAHAAPRSPQPENDLQALIILHHTRTQLASMPLRKRAYSHRWLLDHGVPSGLPDDLKPRCERMYPQVVSGVGISVNIRGPHRDLGLAIRQAMSDAVEDAYAHHQTEATFVHARMMEARAKVLKS